jgi:hypothetical protein
VQRIIAARVRLLAIFAICAALAALIWITITWVPTVCRTGTFFDHTSGVWVATAFDLRHGLFYRPAHGPAGYGGTRYFPLYFTALAGVWRLFDSWRVAAYGMGVFSVLLLMTSVFFLLRRLGTSRWLALAGGITVLAGAAVQDTFIKIRADAFAAALNLLGMAWCLTPAPRRRHLITAAALFTLAFATKLTIVFGAASIVIWFLLSGRRAEAWRLAAYTAAGYAAVVAGIFVFGGAAAFQSMRLSASGGASLAAFLTAGPDQLVEMFKISTAECVFFFAALACFLTEQRRSVRTVQGIFFLAILAVTLLVLASPGTYRNQLVDLYAASMILCLTWMAAKPNRVLPGMVVFAVLLAIATSSTRDLQRAWNGASYSADAQKMLRRVASEPAPIFFENPLLAVETNRQPYVLDPFMFMVIDQKVPGWGDDLRRKIGQREFAFIVLDRDPRLKYDRRWYDTLAYGPWFVPLLQKNYDFVTRGQFFTLYRPKPTHNRAP